MKCNFWMTQSESFNPIAIGIPLMAIGTAKRRSSDTGPWRAAMGIAEFFISQPSSSQGWRFGMLFSIPFPLLKTLALLVTHFLCF